MAEISQNPVGESQAIKPGIRYTTPARKSYGTPDQTAGMVEGQKSKAFAATADAIGSLGLIGAKLRESQERLIAGKIKTRMDEDHMNMMNQLQIHSKNTEIENLDFENFRWDFQNRHSEDFFIGESGADGKPTKLIKDKALDEYDLPSSQREQLTDYYNNLEKSAQKWILDNIPEIQTDKDLFYMGQIISNSVMEINEILEDPDNRGGWVHKDPLTGKITKQGEYYEHPIFGKTLYTGELGIIAQGKIDGILSNADLEIAKRMHAGTLGVEAAVKLQQELSEQVLERQFINDKMRDPKGTFLKILKQGYSIERDISLGVGETRKKIMQKHTLPPAITDVFMLTYSDKKYRQSAEQIKEGRIIAGYPILTLVNSKEYLDDPENNQDTVKKALMDGAGWSEYEAAASAWKWHSTNKAHDLGVDKVLADNVFSVIEKEFTNNPELAASIYGAIDKDGDSVSISKPKLQKLLMSKIMLVFFVAIKFF